MVRESALLATLALRTSGRKIVHEGSSAAPSKVSLRVLTSPPAPELDDELLAAPPAPEDEALLASLEEDDAPPVPALGSPEQAERSTTARSARAGLCASKRGLIMGARSHAGSARDKSD